MLNICFTLSLLLLDNPFFTALLFTPRQLRAGVIINVTSAQFD